MIHFFLAVKETRRGNQWRIKQATLSIGSASYQCVGLLRSWLLSYQSVDNAYLATIRVWCSWSWQKQTSKETLLFFGSPRQWLVLLAWFCRRRGEGSKNRPVNPKYFHGNRDTWTGTFTSLAILPQFLGTGGGGAPAVAAPHYMTCALSEKVLFNSWI